MGYLSSFPADATLREVLSLNRAARRALTLAQDAAFAPGCRLTAADKELIADHVSSLDANPRASDGRLAPILACARKLSLTPSRVTAVDANAVLASGWTERDLQDTVLVTALVVFVNGLRAGHGLTGVRDPLGAEHKESIFDCALPLRWLE